MWSHSCKHGTCNINNCRVAQGGGVGALLLGLIYAFQEKLVRGANQLCQLHT
jgi:hypothetical protein